jgi:hypothetical protein
MSFPETLLSVLSHFHNSLVLTFEIIHDKEEKSLSLGLHLVLCCGTSLLIVRWKIIRVLLVPNNCDWNVGTAFFEETTVKRTFYCSVIWNLVF